MPRKRIKTRLDHLADALLAAQQAGLALEEIDLRKTSGPLRDAIKQARTESEALRERLQTAILADRPS